MSDPQDEIVLDVRGLTKRYGDRTVLADVSLRVPRGQVHAIVGPSGCGKSTLLRCVNGLEPFDGGTVRLDGIELDAGLGFREFRRRARLLRRRAGMVFQQFHLFPHRTALENVMEGLLYVVGLDWNTARAEALCLLEQVGVAHRADAYPAELSGGEQQRVALARALATQPAVLLLDEPTSALDPPRAAEVRHVIQRLAEAGQAMLIATHSPSLVRSTAHRVLMMDKGHIVEEGTPEELFTSPRHPATARYVEAAFG